MAQSDRVLTPFTTEASDELPVGVQLSWRLRALIAGGRLTPGDALPGVRPLAEWAGVNVNTVRTVYRRLEDEGIVVTRQGRGTFVAADARATPELEEIATEAIERALEAGAEPRDLAVVAMVCASVPEIEAEPAPSDLPGIEPGGDEIEVRRELRRQIGRLEAELAAYVRELSAPEAEPRWGEAQGRIVGVEELERTRDGLLDRLDEARRIAESESAGQSRARAQREEMLADPGSHRWERVTASDAGEPGCVNYRVVPRYGPLGALMNWWRVKVSGGCPLPGPLEAAAENNGRS